ncbi:MAG: MSHA biogenesis protein MshM [Motiliproteus sp.]|jgi:MSHA biogenesis protein MshM
MYKYYFGLSELPFTLTPNTHFFLNMPTHQEALNLILVALENSEGFVKIVGEVGTGKTLLCRKVLNSLDENCISAYIPNPYLNPDEFRMSFALELGVDVQMLKGSFDLLERINQRLVERVAEGKRVVLVVDEAQAMPEKTLEALRLLTNLETETTKLFQVLLFGQPELDQLLRQHSLRQLRQRITFSYRLQALDSEATGQYLHHRLTLAGYTGATLFNRKAINLLWEAAAGTPRLINILAHKAMMVAYGKGEHQITPAHIKRAVEDTDGVQLKSSAVTGGIAAVCLVALTIAAWLVLGGGL